MIDLYYWPTPTVRAYARAAEFQNPAVVTDDSRKILFGQTAANVR